MTSPSKRINNLLDKKVNRKKFLQILGLGVAAIPLLSPSVAAKFFLRQTNGTLIDIDDLSPGTATWGSISGTLSSQTDLQTALDDKANDADVVKLTGNQTIAGTKTFSSTITGSIDGNAATASSVAWIDVSSKPDTATWPTNTWLTSSTDSNERLYFANTSHTYLKSLGDIYLRAGGNNNKLTITNTETLIQGDSTNTSWTTPGQLAIKRSTGSPFISFHAETGARNGYLQIQDAGAARLSVEANQPLHLATNGTDHLTILGGGNVGIGTTNPVNKLHVSLQDSSTDTVLGVARIGRGTTGTPTIGGGAEIAFETPSTASPEGVFMAGIRTISTGIGSGSDLHGALAFRTRTTSSDTSEKMRIDKDGNVGIGTDTPRQKMHIHSVSGSQLQFTDDTTGSELGDGLRIGWNGSLGQMWLFENANIRLATNNTERITITNNGDVGIGITNPSSLLHVNGSITSGTINSSTITASNFHGTGLTSTFSSTNYSVGGVSTSFVNSGFVIPNVNGSWIVTIHAPFTGGFSSTATYIITCASYSKTINLIGGPSNHFGNGYILAQLSSSSAADVYFQVRKSTTTGGNVTIYTNVLRLN